MKIVGFVMLAACGKPAEPPSCVGVVQHLAKVIHAEPNGAWFERDVRNCSAAPWTWAHKSCVLEAKNQKEIDACVLPVAPTLPGPGNPVPPAPPKKPRGMECVADAECDATMKCVPWATEGGVAHATCEIRCVPIPDDQSCPAGTRCVLQKDGPSEVCR